LSKRVRKGKLMSKLSRSLAGMVAGIALLALAACGSTSSAAATPVPKPTANPASAPAPWRIVSSPNVEYPVPSVNGLNAMSAISPSDAWAVGGTFAGAPGPAASLIERWDGTTWRLVDNPGPGNLYGVTAVSANDAWAVGRQGGNYDPQSQQYVYTTLIMHWNGTQWSVVPSPSPNPMGSYLNSVAAIAANDVWAVGYTQSPPTAGAEALIEHWDGASWRVVTSPIPASATGSAYTSVTRIPGTQQLWAVGSTRFGPIAGTDADYFQVLIERWDGSAWHSVAGPLLPSGAFSGNLNGVVALSATDAWAVGDYTGSDHTTHTLIAHWDGASWKVATGPDRHGSLVSVAAAGTHDVRAVGYIFTGETNSQHLLIEQWNGTVWQVAPSPEPSGTLFSGLSGVTTDGAGNYWSVGFYTPGSTRTLIVRCP
jgi:hypothetical protein